MHEDDIRRVVTETLARIPSTQPEQLAYSVARAAEACDVPQSVIRKAISAGQLRARSTGRQYIITREALLRWLSR